MVGLQLPECLESIAMLCDGSKAGICLQYHRIKSTGCVVKIKTVTTGLPVSSELQHVRQLKCFLMKPLAFMIHWVPFGRVS